MKSVMLNLPSNSLVSPFMLTFSIGFCCRSGELQRLSDVKATVPSGWLSWGFGILVKKPLSWTFSTFVKRPLAALVGSKEDAGEDLVIVELLKVSFASYDVLICW